MFFSTLCALLVQALTVISLLPIASSSSLHHEIHDLVNSVVSCFQPEAETWSSSITMTSSSIFTDEPNRPMLGGYSWHPGINPNGQSLKKTFSSLLPHVTISIVIQLFLFDNWVSSDQFILKIDNTVMSNRWTSTKTQALYGGYPLTDTTFTLFEHTPHSADSVTIEFAYSTSSLTLDKSFGVRTLRIYMRNSPLSSVVSCVREPSFFGNPPGCSCLNSEYHVGSGSCLPCDSACINCFGGGPGKCSGCAVGYYFNGDVCTNVCQILNCNFCILPTECRICSTGYVRFNGICLPETRCNVSPFIVEGCTIYKYCPTPCDTEDLSSWGVDCIPPCLSSTAIPDLSTVCHECTEMKVQYTKEIENGHSYQIQLRPSSCDFDITTFTQYLKISEQVFGSVGSFSFEAQKLGSNLFQVDLSFEKRVDKASSLNAKLDFLSGVMEVPKDSLYETLDNTAAIVRATFIGLLGGSLIGTLALGATSSLWSIVSFQQFVGYFIYINVEYPKHLEVFYSMLGSSFWDLLPNPLAAVSESLLEKLIVSTNINTEDFQPPYKFREDEKTPFFIENGGTIIFTNLGLLMILGLTLVFRKYFEHVRLFKALKVYLRWNVIARTFLENCIPLTLAVCLQLRVFVFEGAYLTISLIFTIFSLIYIIGAIIFLMRILVKRSTDLLQKGLIRRIYGTLYEGVKLNNSTSKYYYLIIMFRGMLLMVLISFFEDSPLLQIIPLMFYNGALIYYQFRLLTFENPKFDKIVKFKEIAILLGEICILCLRIKTNSESYYDIVGWLIIILFASALLVEFGFMLGLQIMEIKTIFRNIWEFFSSCCKNTPPTVKNKRRQGFPGGPRPRIHPDTILTNNNIAEK